MGILGCLCGSQRRHNCPWGPLSPAQRRHQGPRLKLAGRGQRRPQTGPAAVSRGHESEALEAGRTPWPRGWVHNQPVPVSAQHGDGGSGTLRTGEARGQTKGHCRACAPVRGPESCLPHRVGRTCLASAQRHRHPLRQAWRRTPATQAAALSCDTSASPRGPRAQTRRRRLAQRPCRAS